MQDLVFSYKDKNGGMQKQTYLHIFDFTDAVEAKSANVPAMESCDVSACFFENPMNVQHFDTVRDLYEHCKRIMK